MADQWCATPQKQWFWLSHFDVSVWVWSVSLALKTKGGAHGRPGGPPPTCIFDQNTGDFDAFWMDRWWNDQNTRGFRCFLDGMVIYQAFLMVFLESQKCKNSYVLKYFWGVWAHGQSMTLHGIPGVQKQLQGFFSVFVMLININIQNLRNLGLDRMWTSTIWQIPFCFCYIRILNIIPGQPDLGASEF